MAPLVVLKLILEVVMALWLILDYSNMFCALTESSLK